MEHPPKDFTTEESSYLFRVLQALETKLNIAYNKVFDNTLPTVKSVQIVSGVMKLPGGTDVFSLTSGTLLNTIKASENDIGRIITIKLTAANVTIVNSANLVLKDGLNKTTFANDVIVLRCIGVDAWVELAYHFALGKPLAYAWRNSVDFVVSVFGVATKFPHNAVRTDTYGSFNTTSNDFICPTAGYYSVHASLRIKSFTGSTSMLVYIFQNGSTTTYSSSVSFSAGESVTCSAVLKCAAGDTISSYYLINGTAATFFGETGSQLIVAML